MAFCVLAKILELSAQECYEYGLRESQVLLSLGNCLSFLMYGNLILDVCLLSFALPCVQQMEGNELVCTAKILFNGMTSILRFFSNTYSI